MSDIRVLIVDDQRLVREGIASLLALQKGIAVVGTAENGRDGLFAARDLKPDVILMDIRMPVLDGIAAAQRLNDENSASRIIMLTTFDDEEYIVKSLMAGALGYLMKDIPIEDLTRAIQMVMNGTFQLSPGVMGILVERLDHSVTKRTVEVGSEDQALWKSLSTREQEILRGIAEGDTNREIAEKVHLSEGTVKNYVSDILSALGLRDRTQAALMAYRNGWTNP